MEEYETLILRGYNTIFVSVSNEQLMCAGTSGLPCVVDEYAEPQIPSVHSPERLQDDCGTTKRHQGQSAEILHWLQ